MDLSIGTKARLKRLAGGQSEETSNAACMRRLLTEGRP